jgi:hypothetical protein
MTDFFTIKADEVKPVDTFVDLFSVENPALELFYPNPEQFFIVSFYFASSSLVAR